MSVSSGICAARTGVPPFESDSTLRTLGDRYCCTAGESMEPCGGTETFGEHLLNEGASRVILGSPENSA